MKDYTAINDKNVLYSFKAYNDYMAKDFATHKFSTPFKRIIIILNYDPEAPAHHGRLVWANGKHFDY